MIKFSFHKKRLPIEGGPICFSASASFTSSALLLPTGVYCIRQALLLKRKYLFIASYIILFSIQQAFEGGVWLGIKNGNAETIRLLSTLFLSFSFFIWLVLAPLSVAIIETSLFKRRLFYGFTALGLILGSFLYVPLLFYDNWLEVEVINHSIFYNARFISDGLITKDQIGLIYAFIVIIPMLLSSSRHIRPFGLVLLLSGLPAYFAYYYTFTSVWCFFAGVVSLYILYILKGVLKYEGEAIKPA